MTDDERYDLIRGAARDASELVIEHMVSILADENQPADLRIQAAQLLLDCGTGA